MAIWTDTKAWFKNVAAKFASHPGSLPSDFFQMQVDVPTKHAELANDILAKAGVKRYGIRLHGAGEYPAKLRDAQHPIELLYYQGFWDLVETRAVAVVGTRKPSSDGIARASKLARRLSADGFTVVSGLATGIDTAAHKAAIESGTPTIAVIGTALSSAYPPENAELQSIIARDHLLISQVPVIRYAAQGPFLNKRFFPERNVTMSALTEATIIVEASDTSGTLTQARAALHQGRKLFILDSCFHVKGLRWPALYERRGAIRVKEYEDIQRHLNP
jgi:DNA processing protein